MARQPRMVEDGSILHILQRGNNGRRLFRDTADFLKFRTLIKRYQNKYPFDLYNYCLMPTHIHLLIRIIAQKYLSKIFQGIFQVFQLHHRKKYGYMGRLYQNRYKSLLIINDAYLLECARYIERNPLRAKLVNSLEDYPWSSYHFYAKGEKDSLITPNPLYLELSKNAYKRKKLYRRYILQTRPHEDIFEENLEKLCWNGAEVCPPQACPH